MIVETAELASYRSRVRAWLTEHVPRDWQETMSDSNDAQTLDFQRRWLNELREGGYAAQHWPAEFGGGASVSEQVVLHEEFARAEAPELTMLVVSLGPAALTLIAHGTPAQQRHLEAILQGELWCQGFSEPEAGSDLASLRTTARRHGDVYVVNGQKVWSTMAHHAQWCLLLARTDVAAPKRRGISFFLLDMSSPGVVARPIKQINGRYEFCELFLTDVEIPAGQLLGAENDGWRVAQTTLSAERGPGVLELVERLRRELAMLYGVARETGSAGDSAVRQTLADHYADVEVLRLLCDRMIDRRVRGEDLGLDGSVVKVFFSELLQRMTDDGVKLEGLPAQLVKHHGAAADRLTSGVWMADYLSSWSWTIAGGTNQIQRNLIAERELGLPREVDQA